MSARAKLALSVAAVFLLNLAIILPVQFSASAATYRQGSNGDAVKQIQTKLRDWGYYKGKVDGIYGSATTEAIKYFQRKNGLAADGVCGPKTLAALGVSAATSSASPQSGDIYLLSRIISAESRGEPYSGQVAVGAVALNRVKHPSFPNSLSDVIYQKGAFTAITDGQFDQPISDSARRAARDAVNGWDPSGGAIYYYNPATATSAWMRSRPQIVRIGQHVFCG